MTDGSARAEPQLPGELFESSRKLLPAALKLGKSWASKVDTKRFEIANDVTVMMATKETARATYAYLLCLKGARALPLLFFIRRSGDARAPRASLAHRSERFVLVPLVTQHLRQGSALIVQMAVVKGDLM